MKPSKQIWFLPLLLTLLFTTSAWAQAPSAPTTNATAGAVPTADVLKPLAGQTVDLILVAGQSNAVGFDCNPAELPADPNDQKVIFWWRCGDPPPDEHDSTSGGQWQQLQPQPRGHPLTGQYRNFSQYGNFSNPAGGFGPEMGLGRSLEAKEGKPLAILKVAYSGTALYDSWNPDPAPGGVCYQALLSEAKLAIQAAQAKGVTLRPHALIWVQGESDSFAVNIPPYEKELTALVASLRHELNAPGLIALFGFNTHFDNLTSGIVQAQQAVASHDPLCAYVDTSSAPVVNASHFSSAGSLQVGDLFAQALLKISAPKTP